MPAPIEIHPHLPFVPPHASVLIIGSFPGRHHVQVSDKDEWFYASPRNQFWPILRQVYTLPLSNTAEKKALFTQKGIAITDIFLKIRRKENTNSDAHIDVVAYNDEAIHQILNSNEFQKVFFTSQLVQRHFMKCFPLAKNGECLPSPSPRYARMSFAEKVAWYKKKLP